MQELKLTKRAIENLPHTKSGQSFYRDTVLAGFGLRVGKTSKTFYVERKLNNKSKRISLGRFGLVSLAEARVKALSLLADMADGVDPTAQEDEAEDRNITVYGAFRHLFETRPHLSKVTVEGYTRTYEFYLRAWRDLPLQEITRHMVLAKHKELTRRHGAVSANNAFRHLRSAYNCAAALEEDFPSNPVDVLKHARAWNKERRRTTIIQRHQLADWWKALMTEPTYSRDFLLVALFTGMRRSEVTHLRWENIDLVGRTLHIPNTKNGDPLDLPLSGFLVDLFTARARETEGSPWVFPGPGEEGHFIEIKRALKRVSETSGVKFTTHDLRRTFITIAESIDIPYYALKRMLNHRTSADVTGGYIVIDAERLRAPVEQVAARILELVGQAD